MINPFKSCDCAKITKSQVYRLGDLIELPETSGFVFNEVGTDVMTYYVGMFNGVPMGKRYFEKELIKLDLNMMVKDVF